jgi:hypothetical protein
VLQVVTPEEPLPLDPADKGKGPAPATTIPVVIANDDDEEEEEDLQPLSHRSCQPPPKILGQSTSGTKRSGDEEEVPAASAPKRRRRTVGRRVARQVTEFPSDSEVTMSDPGVPADAPVADTDTEEEEEEGAVADEAPIADDPEPPAMKRPESEPPMTVAPGGELNTPPVAAVATAVGAKNEVPGETQGSAKRFKKKVIKVNKTTR